MEPLQDTTFAEDILYLLTERDPLNTSARDIRRLLAREGYNASALSRASGPVESEIYRRVALYEQKNRHRRDPQKYRECLLELTLPYLEQEHPDSFVERTRNSSSKYLPHVVHPEQTSPLESYAVRLFPSPPFPVSAEETRPLEELFDAPPTPADPPTRPSIYGSAYRPSAASRLYTAAKSLSSRFFHRKPRMYIPEKFRPKA